LIQRLERVKKMIRDSHLAHPSTETSSRSGGELPINAQRVGRYGIALDGDSTEAHRGITSPQ
jgi:hypothetical protein